MNPDNRSLSNSKIMRMALGRINPYFERDLRNSYRDHDINQNRRDAFGGIVNKSKKKR